MDGLFGFMSMANNYEDRAVKHTETADGLTIDTCAVTDSSKPYETAIQHPEYNHGKWIIVELYDTKEEAGLGHEKWLSTMKQDALPEQLVDISSCDLVEFGKALGMPDERFIFKREASK